MTRRKEALEELNRAGFLARQPDGYWATDPFQPAPGYAERTILDLIRNGEARVTKHDRKSHRGRMRPTRIEGTTNDQDRLEHDAT